MFCCFCNPEGDNTDEEIFYEGNDNKKLSKEKQEMVETIISCLSSSILGVLRVHDDENFYDYIIECLSIHRGNINQSILNFIIAQIIDMPDEKVLKFNSIKNLNSANVDEFYTILSLAILFGSFLGKELIIKKTPGAIRDNYKVVTYKEIKNYIQKCKDENFNISIDANHSIEINTILDLILVFMAKYHCCIKPDEHYNKIKKRVDSIARFKLCFNKPHNTTNQRELNDGMMKSLSSISNNEINIMSYITETLKLMIKHIFNKSYKRNSFSKSFNNAPLQDGKSAAILFKEIYSNLNTESLTILNKYKDKQITRKEFIEIKDILTEILSCSSMLVSDICHQTEFTEQLDLSKSKHDDKVSKYLDELMNHHTFYQNNNHYCKINNIYDLIGWYMFYEHSVLITLLDVNSRDSRNTAKEESVTPPNGNATFLLSDKIIEQNTTEGKSIVYDMKASTL